MTARCRWCNPKNPLYVAYHDTEWGVMPADDRALFELLILEGFQAGLSWECVLNKRAAFREAFDGFDPRAVAAFGEEKIRTLLADPRIIRCERKIRAAVKNARVFLAITAECGSFAAYLARFTEGKTVFETERTSSPLSERLSADLKSRGMSYVGPTVIYAYLQAVGAVYSHGRECFLYKEG